MLVLKTCEMLNTEGGINNNNNLKNTPQNIFKSPSSQRSQELTWKYTHNLEHCLDNKNRHFLIIQQSILLINR